MDKKALIIICHGLLLFTVYKAPGQSMRQVNKIDSIVLVPASAGNSMQQDALNALVALGITRVQAESAIKKISLVENNTNNLEELIKKALKAI